MRASKKAVDTDDRLDQVAKMKAAGYIPATEVSEKTGYTLTTIARWANEDAVESEVVAGKRYVKLESLIKHLGPTQATIFGFLAEPKKKAGKT